ncbi:type II toxin-antitoxin system HicB family antitoxin [Desulfofundulus thermobenzoicus]|uniref:Type II toxin-antitoxin system HicB family antitoxin n=1 Tax=Desulfofundulus thermobenzoicus TaxID=29376 RepID=A0A6N7IN95_9FIRM|nr:type II toxin-antitoxin system HicB family antitoxin [Desulfofundulus thermobenzoicus]MQL51404.1 type II toxin-antitoxin system HicB family antitoxin [Desulfofundulus thermobenzoicus]HHW43228.1 type II toxin-antitoxin system HicB family antitoxin [Desulfotomaculum sp.]
MAGRIEFKAQFFKEGDVYVGLSPELNISSFGDTIQEAKKSLVEAVEVFLEECAKMGTLEEVLEEAGFMKNQDTWTYRRSVDEEKLVVSM